MIEQLCHTRYLDSEQHEVLAEAELIMKLLYIVYGRVRDGMGYTSKDVISWIGLWVSWNTVFREV